jgi:uroporphyrinogen-III synthase
MNSSTDVKVASLEARMSSEMADLIRRHGGIPYSVPAVREIALDCRSEVSLLLDHLLRDRIQIVIFLTGVGVKALFKEAEALERFPELLDALRKVIVVCRGPKPIAVLKREGIPIALSAVEPHTTSELLQALATLDLRGKGVAMLHYGERNTVLTEALHASGVAMLEELCLYEWFLPEDLTPLQTLIHEIIAQRVEAVVFTSQVQAHHLLHVAADLHLKEQLTEALNHKTIVASVGPTCTRTLREYGITPQVEPEHPKMGHLVKELMVYIQAQTSG